MAKDVKQGPETPGTAQTEGGDRERHPVCPFASLAGAAGILGDKVLEGLPEEFVVHAAGVRREFLLALRSLLDEALRLEDAGLERYRDYRTAAKTGSRRPGPEKVTVE